MKVRIEIEIPINEDALELLRQRREDDWRDGVTKLVRGFMLCSIENEPPRWSIARRLDDGTVVFAGLDDGMSLDRRHRGGQPEYEEGDQKLFQRVDFSPSIEVID